MAGNGLGYPPQRVYNLGIQLKFYSEWYYKNLNTVYFLN